MLRCILSVFLIAIMILPSDVFEFYKFKFRGQRTDLDEPVQQRIFNNLDSSLKLFNRTYMFIKEIKIVLEDSVTKENESQALNRKRFLYLEKLIGRKLDVKKRRIVFEKNYKPITGSYYQYGWRIIPVIAIGN